MNKRILFFSITALGISSVITQILLIREFHSVFLGNELVFGIILANWLLLTGVGAYLGKLSDLITRKFRFIIFSQIAVAFLPFISIFLIRYLRNVIFPAGSLISIVQVFISSFILLLPYCIISGFLLTLFCTVFSTKNDAASIGRVYFIDNIGDIIGGFLFSFILIYFFNPFQTIFIIMFVNLLAALFLAYSRYKTLKIIIFLLLILSFSFILVNFNRISTELQYRDQQLVFQKNSLYGNLVVTRTDGQLNFFENGIMLFSTENTVNNEETVHYSMSQHDDPEEILLISGGVAGTAKEILKYDPDKIDYVELDPLVIQIGKRFTDNLDDERINTVNRDARLFVRQTKNRYDVVIIDLPDPSTAQINRFYTLEFFRELKSILNEKGIISLSLSSSPNYIDKHTKQLNSILYNTLSRSFENILLIPGDKTFFIASDSDLDYDIAEKIEGKNIQTIYVNEHYLKGILTDDRIDYLRNSIDLDTKLNNDFTPVTYYYHIIYWLSFFRTNYLLFLGMILILTILFISRLKEISFSLFTTGFAASSLEVTLLISFQIISGLVYHMIGIIITMFMLGLALGSFYMNRHLKKTTISGFIRLEFIIAAYSVALPFILILLNRLNPGLLFNQIIFSLLALIIAIFVGMEFPLASKLHFKNIPETAARLYNADLIGSAIGALLVSSLLIPLIGIVNVCLLIGLLNIISGMIIVLRKNYILK